jgi:hypothetical protein
VNAQGFDAARDALVAARSAADHARAAASQAAERQRALAAELARLDRTLDPHDREGEAERAKVAAGLEQATAAAAGARDAAVRAAEAAAGALVGFETFTDPRRNAGLLDDGIPFALLPVRIETRFMSVADGELARDELWVRVYPDDCWVDTFEPMLSTTELANAQRYWRGIWRAGGVEPDERGAWRALVTAHGSGRAGFIVDTYRPANLADAPKKAKDDDEILVIPTQTPLAAAEAGAVAAYWQAIWLAGDDAAKQKAARDALVAAVGAARADALVAAYVPYNLDDAPAEPTTKADVALSTAFVVFPADPPTKQAPWSQAPRVTLFPERFVVVCEPDDGPPVEAIGSLVTLPLYVGPDPSADPSETIHPDGADLFVPDELKWLVDFERAVEVGMGVRVPLTPAQAEAGFARVLVLGLTLAADRRNGQAALETLLTHHAIGRSGLTLVPQGTPTHNTTGFETGYSRLEDPDLSFDDRRNAPLFATTSDPLLKRDGQWLAELLGVDPALFERIHGADGQDQLRARALNRALWPATLGYWLDKMLAPVFSDETVDLTRWFFTGYVSGRGAVPAIRIGGQPYGVLPTTAFSRIAWLGGDEVGRAGFGSERAFLARLLELANLVGADWQEMESGVSSVGKPGDAHQLLLDIVGQHPSSVEFHSRYAESLTELYNVVNLFGFGPDWWQAILALALEQAGVALLARLGYAGTEQPDILQHVFMNDAGQIANVVDDRPLSETAGIRGYTTDGRNYVEWLIAAAGQSLDALVAEDGFDKDVAPQALLYLYLRHALMLGYYDASYGLHRSAGFLSAAELAAMKPEPTFVHVAEPAGEASESRFAALYKTEARITSSPTLLVSDYITANLGLLLETAGLQDQLAALALLADAPTAQLERAFAEHVDVCSYRFDAWLLGIVHYQLQAMRAGEGDDGGARAGIYLGAYAWVEDLRPSSARLSPVQPPPDVAKNLGLDGTVLADARNGGYIHAPSLPHAQTAAILRSGYLANATAANPDTMAVNLSSDRVRLALSVLEGIRNGQNLGALLGYRFERGLHDAYGLAEVDELIFPLRKAFPLASEGLLPTQTPPNVPIEAIEARNVLDGRKLVAQIRSSGVTTYPFGVSGLPPVTPAQQTAVDRETDALLDVYDAVADLALAEGVHQAAQGNFDRVAATLEAYSTGNFPPDPEVVQTPAPGVGLAHRVALHLRPGLAAPAGATPRAQAEPALDDWLARMLPDLAHVGCRVAWTDPLDGTAKHQDVTLADLHLRPLDVLELVRVDGVQSMSELDDRILRHVFATAAPRPDAALQIRYLNAPAGAGRVSVFELAPLVRALRTLVIGSRPLRATDATLQGDADPKQDAAPFVDRARIETPKGALDTLDLDVGAFLGMLEPLVADPVAHRAQIVAGIEGFVDDAIALLERAARFNLPSSGWGFAYGWRHSAYIDLFAQIAGLAKRWQDRLDEFDSALLAYDALPGPTPDTERFELLRAAELLVSTSAEPAATPAALRPALDPKRTAFATRRGDFLKAVQNAGSSFPTTLASVQALLPIDAFDTQPFDLVPFGDRIVVLAEDLVRTLTGQKTQIESRLKATQTQLDAETTAASATAKADALVAAASALLGDDFRIVPEFAIGAAQGAEWEKAVAASGSLLDYLVTTANVDFPVDEWLTGAARVRPQLHAWETALALVDGFELPVPDLVPLQLPFAAGASWLALQFPPDQAPDGDRLLYTAHYSTPFDKAARQCGLLLDEWTETIPGTTRATGITFNYDRPDNEPPQAILLVTPASATGTWQWDDLVGALDETLDLAKKRAVEPVQIEATAYSRFLPATIMAATLYGISITTALAAANGVSRFLGSDNA